MTFSKRFFVGALLAAIFVMPTQAQSFFWQKEEAKPEIEVLKPDYPTKPVPEWLEFESEAEKKLDLSASHRTEQEIEHWAEDAVIEVMTFDFQDYRSRFKSFQPYFAPSGWGEYVDYVDKTALLKRVTDNRYALSTIVQGQTKIVNTGVLEGRHRWLVQVPVMTSFFKQKSNGALDGRAVEGGQLIVTAQVGRVKEGLDNNGLLVESWAVSIPPR